MSDAVPDYSVVIPCFNEEAFLPATLRSVHEAMAGVTSHRGEIVVTDNDSTDASAALARAAGAHVVFEAHRQISRARNVGARHARGRFLIFVDADTTISARLLRATLAALESGRVCGGGTSVTVDIPLGRAARSALALWGVISRRLRFACGAYLFCRADAFAAVGGFPETVYATEELWLCSALRRHGRARGLALVILDEPIVTSARKIQWYGPRELARAALLLLRPRALQSREACGFWYERPAQRSDSRAG